MHNNDQQQRHRQRMQRKKTLIDATIDAASEERGLILLHTGNGKGKSSSAFGMVARALGHGMKVGVAQFIKGRSDTGEEAFFRQHADVIWHVLGEGFTWDTQDLSRDTETARQGWAVARQLLQNDALGLVVLDELTYPIKFGWLALDDIVADLHARPAPQHVVITGRGAVPGLLDCADTITEFGDVKHAYRAGIKAQKGVDW